MNAVIDGQQDRARQAAHNHLAFADVTLQNLSKEETHSDCAQRRLSPFYNQQVLQKSVATCSLS